MTELIDFDKLFADAWRNHRTFLDRLYDQLTAGAWEPDPPQVTYRIWGLDGLPIACHLSGCLDQWQLEGLESQRKATVFVCDHGHQVCGPQVAIRKISSVPVWKVSRFEVAHRPVDD